MILNQPPLTPPLVGNQSNFSLVCNKAHEDATEFHDNYLSGTTREFFDREPRLIKRAVSDVIKFCTLHAALSVQTVLVLPRPNFASWLIKLSPTQGGIAMAENQMRQWEWMPPDGNPYHAKGIPVPTQKIRSMIHELGHHVISDLCGLNSTIRTGVPAGQPVAPSVPHEEELAWVYAFTFLGILLGDYALESRSGLLDMDDLPRVFV